jgi:hypothetical protein
MDGFANRFGLVYVDFDTQQRIPKLRAEWLREAARRSAGARTIDVTPRRTTSARARPTVGLRG